MANAKQLENKELSLRKHSFGMIVALAVQYLLGIVTNLFVTFPDSSNDKELWEFARTQIPLVLHIVVGFLLLFGSMALFIRSNKYKYRTWQISSGINLIAVLAAFIMGVKFIPSQSDTYSFLMAVGFIVAVLSLGWGIYSSTLSKPRN